MDGVRRIGRASTLEMRTCRVGRRSSSSAWEKVIPRYARGTATQGNRTPARRPPLWNLLVAGFFLAVFLSCFASVLGAEYAYRGDLRIIEGPPDPFAAETFADGRPIKAPIMMLLRRTATEIEHLRSIRLVGVLGIALLAWCVLLPRVSGFRTAPTGARRRRRTGIRKRL